MKQVNNFETDDFDFNLPEELIAQVPLKDRSASKLMVLDHAQETIEDKTFLDIIDELQPNDALVMTTTRGLPARLWGRETETGGHLEALPRKDTQRDRWKTLMKAGKKAKIGTTSRFGYGCLTAE